MPTASTSTPSSCLSAILRSSARVCCAHARALSGQQRFRNHGTVGDGLVIDQDEADEAHAIATSLGEKFGGSLGVIIAHMRWPHHLADALPNADDPA